MSMALEMRVKEAERKITALENHLLTTQTQLDEALALLRAITRSNTPQKQQAEARR